MPGTFKEMEFAIHTLLQKFILIGFDRFDRYDRIFRTKQYQSRGSSFRHMMERRDLFKVPFDFRKTITSRNHIYNRII